MDSDTTRQLLYALGVFSLSLGTAQLAAPGAMTRARRRAAISTAAVAGVTVADLLAALQL